MKWNHNTYKVIKSLRPIDLYEIMTRGVCSDYTEEIKRQVISIRGEWFLNNWHNEIKLDVLDLYLSDTGFKLFTTKKIMELKDRQAASLSVPPQGLFLWEINY